MSAAAPLAELAEEAQAVRCVARLSGEADSYAAALARARSRPPVDAGERAALEGRLLLALGRVEEAVPLLARAADARPRDPWPRFLLAAARLGQGDAAAASRACEELLAERPRLAAALALRGLIRAQRGEAAAGRADLEAAAALRPRHAWPLVLAALARKAAGDVAGAKDALVEAARREPSAELFAELARVYEALGIVPAALEAASRAVELDASEANRRLKAHLHTCWREYDLAAGEYELALARAPSADLRFMRSKALACGARLAEALEEADRALAAAPGDHGLLAWKLHLLTVCGRAPAARALILRLLAAGGAARALGLFGRGYAALRAGRAAAAERDFARAAAAGDGALRRKAEFYRCAARAVGARGRRRRPAGLYLIGLGVNPPYSATAEALRALRDCDVVFNNIMDQENFELLRPFCGDCRPLAYHQDGDEDRLSDEIMAAVRPGRTVGFVTRGSAIVYGPLGRELLRRCERAGLAWRCMGAVSSQETFAARLGAGAAALGACAADVAAFDARPALDPAAALTVYLTVERAEAARASYARFCARVREELGPGRACFVFDHVVAQEPLARRADELEDVWASLSPSAIVHVPAGEAR